MALSFDVIIVIQGNVICLRNRWGLCAAITAAGVTTPIMGMAQPVICNSIASEGLV
jgi:hypothetical protein